MRLPIFSHRQPLLPVLLCICVLAPNGQAQSGNNGLQQTQSVVAGGGGESRGGSHSLVGTIGQPILGVSSGGGFTVTSGFFQADLPNSAPNLPDLTATKADDVTGSTTLGEAWTWTIHVSNAGAGSANFADGQTILTDNLPNSAIIYGRASVADPSGVTGIVNCSIAANDLSCTASGAVSLGPGASFNVNFKAVPSATGAFDNPRAGGTCAVDPGGKVSEVDETNNACSDTVTVIAPDLTATKTNNVGGATVLGNSWTWTIRVANSGNAPGIFTSGQTILSDNLPNTNISYGPTSITNVVNVTNSANISCSIVSSDLICNANKATVTIGSASGQFDVTFTATPALVQAATGSTANPRSGGACSVDPNSNVTEGSEGNNACSDTVVVTAVTPVFTDPAGACGGNAPCFTSIQTAINVVAERGFVRVGAGSYSESPDLNRDVTVKLSGIVNLAGLAFSNGTVDGDGSTLSVTGDWIYTGGDFVCGSGMVNFNGATPQTIGGTVTTTFNDLTNSNASGLSMINDTYVNRVLALTGGDITVAPGKTLIHPVAGASIGAEFDVIGAIRRTNDDREFPANTPLTFGNENNIITFAAVGTRPTEITVNLVKSAPARGIGFPNAVKRTYTITPGPSSDISATVRLHYLDSELNGNSEGASLILWRHNGVGWEPVGRSANNTDANWVEKSSVSSFSPWAFQSALAPTASNGTLTGRITTADGVAVEGAVINLSGSQTRKTITDANGKYQFSNVEMNGFYTLIPSRANYSFNPFNRSFSLLGNKTEALFTATSTGDHANPLDTPEYFVRQQYVDVLSREPDEVGFNFWSDRILVCGNDADCIRAQRIAVAAEFFIHQEFQQSGAFIYNLYQSAFGRRPFYAEYALDRQQVVGGPNLEAAKQAFAESFVQRAEFMQKYQASVTAEGFVDALLSSVRQTSGVDLGNQRDHLISHYNTGTNQTQSRSFVLRDVTESAAARDASYNAAFVLTEYFGYLRRDPDRDGYNFWVNVLNNSGNDQSNYQGMVCSFLTSAEYQRRFSAVVSHTNGECWH